MPLEASLPFRRHQHAESLRQAADLEWQLAAGIAVELVAGVTVRFDADARGPAEAHIAATDVRAIVRDWPQMRAKMLEVADDLGKRDMPTVTRAGVAEAQEFLRWAASDHFTFLEPGNRAAWCGAVLEFLPT